jgi:MFS family permease
MVQTARVRPSARSGRWPATTVFFLNGLTLATYIVRLPSLKAEHHLTDAQVGAVGVVFAVAALMAMQFVGPLVARLGGRTVLRVSLVVLPLLLAAVGLARGPAGLTLAVAALGAVHGATDAAMNTHAVAVERLAGRPILNGCHAAWSISAVAASLAASAAAHAGISSAVYLGVVAALLLPGGLVLGPFLRPAAADRRTGSPPARRRTGLRAGWSTTVVALGLTGTVLMVCEGAALGWGAIFLHDSRGASLGLATAAVTAYTAGQTGGRLAGDRLTARFGPAPVFRTGGLIAAGGLALAVLAPPPAAAVAGFAIAGAGASVLIPLVFSAVGRLDDTGHGAATLVSRFTTFTYAGILLGPAVIGTTAQVIGLTATLAALIPLLLAAALTSPVLRPSR